MHIKNICDAKPATLLCIQDGGIGWMHFNLWEDILLYKTRVHSFKIVWVDHVMKTKEKVKEEQTTKTPQDH